MTQASTVIANAISHAIDQLKAAGTLPEDFVDKSGLSRTKDQTHGDFASNIAMMAAKAAQQSPRELAQLITEMLPEVSEIDKVEVAGPGFINFFLSVQNRHAVLDNIVSEGSRFGTIYNEAIAQKGDEPTKVIVEFVSANPTGPLHVGHGRQAALGDAICNLLASQGKRVHREFYYNDAGAQINNLGLSVQARAKGLTPDDADWPADGYRGEYIIDIAQDFLAKKSIAASDRSVSANGDAEDLQAITDFAVAYLRHEQDLDLKAFNLSFDNYFLESSLYASGKVSAAVTALKNSGKTYIQDGALWLKTTEFGDDKDRVMRKSEGGYTYFVPDVAYHLDKFARGFSQAINIQGTDHHGTIARVRAGLQAASQAQGMSIPTDYPSYVLHTMVRVVRGGKEVKISKRSGSYITLRDLIDWTSQDAVRFFLLSRKPDTEFTFDVDLAVEKSNDNPIYYVQYAHARVCAVFSKLAAAGITYDETVAKAQLKTLGTGIETDIISKLAAYPELLTRAADGFEPHLLVNYLRELAARFHSWYGECRIITDSDVEKDKHIMQARLMLSLCVKQVLANGLTLLGVSAPQSM